MTIFLTHSNDVSKLWHEKFGHLNFHYLHQLNQQSMVIGLSFTLTLESLGIHDRSSDELDLPEQYSTPTSDAKSDSENSPPCSPSHHSLVDDSPIDSPFSSPLWAR